MSERLPWFPFTPKDWLDFRVLRMTLSAQGAYMRMLCHAWIDSEDQCSIPSDPSLLGRILGVSKSKTEKLLAEMNPDGDPIWSEMDGRFFSKRLASEKDDGEQRRNAKRVAGKAGARARWGSRMAKDSNANAGPLAGNGYIQGQEQRHIQKEEKEQPASPPSSEDLKLLDLTKAAHTPNRAEVRLRYCRAWVARVGRERVEEVLRSPEAAGLSVIELADTFFSIEKYLVESSESAEAGRLVAAALQGKNTESLDR